MRRSLALAALAVSLGWAQLTRAEEPTPTPTPTAAILVNERHPLPRVLTGGMPKGARGFPGLAGAGVRTVVDLRSDSEVSAETRAAADAAGLSYERVPVRTEADLDRASARALDALLDDPARYPVAIVCASGNRVGALLALRAFWLEGSTAESALDLGHAAGLTRLEPSVRLLLGLPPAAAPTPTPSRPN
jgi:uncharacterized protein (TIGR01244 family)